MVVAWVTLKVVNQMILIFVGKGGIFKTKMCIRDRYKPEMPAITVSALMNGYGRQLADFLKPTYMFQLDFDHAVSYTHLSTSAKKIPSLLRSMGS